MLKIGIVCYPTYGGSGVIATELGKSLADKGHEVHFITYSRPERLESFSNNIFYHEVRGSDYPLFKHSPYDTVLTSKLVEVVKFKSLDILHVHYAIPHATVAYLAKKILLLTEGIYIPVITTLHGTDITLVGKDPSFKSVVEFSINKSDGVTAVSESLKRDTFSNFKISRDIEVIPNFIDFSKFNQLDKEHFKKAIAPNGEKVLIHVSNFRKVKRVEDVVKIFAKVHDKIPCKLLLVGDGPERSRTEALCRDIKKCHDIRFLGKQQAVEELLAISDLFLMPSASESFGLAALEAMACGIPVISTNIGGLPEVNQEGKTGFLSNLGDVDDMANKAYELLKDEAKLEQFKKQAYAHAQQFEISKILPIYEQYYIDVIERSKREKLVNLD